MWLVTTGKMNKQVAGDLGISEITVKIYQARPCTNGRADLRRTGSDGRRPQTEPRETWTIAVGSMAGACEWDYLLVSARREWVTSRFVRG